MRWELTDEQELFRTSLREWLSGTASTETIRTWLDNGDSSSFAARLVSDGWFGVGSPESLGGQGGRLLELALAAEELGRAAVPSGAWLASVLTIPALEAAPDIASSVLEDGQFAAFVAEAGRPLDRPRGLEFDGSALHGAVPSVLGAGSARWLLAPAQVADGLALFLVDANADGIVLSDRRLLDRTRDAADVRLEGVAARRLDVDASAVLVDAALRAAVLVAADSLGAAGRVLDLAVAYSLQRKQFGVPIGSFQAVKHAAATMLVSVESSRSIAYFAAASVDRGGDESTLHAATAKAQVTAASKDAVDSALTMHGAIGYTWEHDLQLFYKRAKLDAELFGSPRTWNERLADALPLLPTA